MDIASVVWFEVEQEKVTAHKEKLDKKRKKIEEKGRCYIAKYSTLIFDGMKHNKATKQALYETAKHYSSNVTHKSLVSLRGQLAFTGHYKALIRETFPVIEFYNFVSWIEENIPDLCLVITAFDGVIYRRKQFEILRKMLISNYSDKVPKPLMDLLISRNYRVQY